MALIKCIECGKEISSSATICPNCGYNLNRIKKRKNIKKLLLLIGILLIVAGIGTSLFFIKKKKINNYKENYKVIITKIENTAPIVIKCANSYMKVWNNTILQESDPETDEFTKTNGIFNQDYKISVEALTKSDEYSSDLEEIEYQYGMILVLMDDLGNPPKKFEEEHEALEELVDSFSNYANFVIKPSETSVASFILRNIELGDDIINCMDNINKELE